MAYSAPPTQSTGDVVTATAWNRLGSNDQWFATDHPLCQASRAGAQAVANLTNTAILFNTNVFDNAAVHSTSVNTTRFTAPSTGWYFFLGQITWPVNATGFRCLIWFRNGVATWSIDCRTAVTGTTTNQHVMYHALMTAGDYMELTAQQNSGGSLNVDVVVVTVEWMHT